DHIKKTKLDLLWQRYHLWTTESSHATRHIWIKDQWGNNLHILREGQQDVADLLRAEARLADPHAHYQLWDGSRRVPHDAVLQDQGQHGPYTLIVNSPTTVPDDDREVEIIFYTNTTVTSATLPLGTYLFQACAAGHISPADTPPVDLQGHAIPLDTRLWCNTTVICRQPFAGAGDSDDGLNDQQIYSQLERLAHLHGELGGDHFQCPSPLLVPHPLPADQTLGPAAALQLQHFSPTTPTTIIFAYNGHWALLTTTPTTDGFSATLYDGMPEPSLEGGHFLARWLSTCWSTPCTSIHVTAIYPQHDDHSCGTIALAHLGYTLDLWSNLHPLDITAWHRRVRDGHPSTTYLHIARGPHSDDDTSGRLATLLAEKGVPQERTTERAAQAIKKLGVKHISEALHNKNAWSVLKALGSQPANSFQWIKPDELALKIQQRAASNYGISTSNKKKNKDKANIAKEPKHDAQINPADLQLVPGTFVGEDGIPVESIPMHSVGKGKTGIAFATVHQMLPYLQAGEQLSTGPLAVLTTTTIPPALRLNLHTEDLMYPAMHSNTQEPVLIQGSLTQLGKTAVTRPTLRSTPDIAPITTSTVKFAVYQDLWQGDWSTFIDGPMKQVMQAFPLLTMCRTSACGDSCQKFHPPVDDDHIDNVVLDIWGRQWVSNSGARTDKARAVCWTALIRTPQLVLPNLLTLSGTNGLFIDPRDPTGRLPDENYGVVWLSGATWQTAHHKHRTTEGSLSIVRLNDRYGLRFHAARLPEAHKELKPDEPYLPVKVTDIYKLFPLPHGTQRQGLIKSLAAWKWRAKPLQPCKGDHNGIGWEIGSQDPPPNSIQGAHGDVMVTKLRTVRPEASNSTLVAFDRTQQYLHGNQDKPSSSASSDPWQSGHDPWATWFNQHPQEGKVPAAPSAADRLQQAEERIKADLHATLQKQIDAQWRTWDEDQDMDTEDTGRFESRFRQLETNVAELQRQNTKFEHWFTEAAEAHQATNMQIESVAKQVHSHQAELTTLNKNVNEHNAELRREMSNGFSNIEALLSKKHRAE
ncbi:unnamed protein product, partial [Effrenium voratum]